MAGYKQSISTAEFDGVPRLVLEQPTGDVRVEGWDRPEIEVSITDERELFVIERTGSQVTIRGVPPRSRGGDDFVFERPNIDLSGLSANLGVLGENIERVAAKVERKVERQFAKAGRNMRGFNIDFGRWSGGRDYTIRVPHTCDINLRSSSGDISIHHVNGTHFIQSSSGDINMHHIKGNSLIGTASGDVSMHGIEGKLGVRTASGDINITEASLKDISVSTASGDVTVNMLTAPESDFEIKGVSGDIDLILPGDSRLTIEVSTLSGDIDSRFQHEMQSRGPGRGRTSTLNINGGGPTARLATVSGDISIHRGKSVNPEREMGEPTRDLGRSSEGDDVMEPEGYVDRKEKELEILQALERGELSAQDAMKRLSDLD